jgi:hypothetical protein
MSQKLSSATAVIGIDIGKNSFHIVGHDQRGVIVLRQKWSRGQVEARLQHRLSAGRCPLLSHKRTGNSSSTSMSPSGSTASMHRAGFLRLSRCSSIHPERVDTGIVVRRPRLGRAPDQSCVAALWGSR